MTVGENIKRFRKEKGLTQKQLGELCNPNTDSYTHLTLPTRTVV